LQRANEDTVGREKVRDGSALGQEFCIVSEDQGDGAMD
jgi:hypothetical protein